MLSTPPQCKKYTPFRQYLFIKKFQVKKLNKTEDGSAVLVSPEDGGNIERSETLV